MWGAATASTTPLSATPSTLQPRLEQIATPGGILISEETRSQLNLELPAELSSQENLKGRTGVEIVWSVFDYLNSGET